MKKKSLALAAPHRWLTLKPLATDYDANWNGLKFWRNSFFVFWTFSLMGHILEFAWVAIPLLFGHESHIATIPIFAVAAPYGLGVLALIWTVYPLIKRKKIGIIGVYILSVIVATAIEFICAAVIVMFMGSNPFWDYSDQPFNLFGFVCLRNSLAFGVAAVPMLYFVFPYFNNLLNKIKENWLNIGFWLLFASYFVIQIWRIWLR